MFDKSILAKNIKKYRTIKNIAQNELAKALFVSPQAVSKWESGVTTPDIENLYNIAGLLEVSVDTLLCDTALPKLMLCVDGGGSKTEFLLFTQDGEIKGRYVLGASNPNLVGVTEAYAVFKKGIDILTKGYWQLGGIYIGAAGMASGNNGEIIEEKLRRDYRNIPVSVKSDIYNVIASADAGEKCIALICGTGSVVYASTPNGLRRFGGWGCRLDTLGSGYDMGREALRASLGERDGLADAGLITTLTEQKLKSTVWDSIHDIYGKGDSYIASFAPVVFEAYSMGDVHAGEILSQNAKRLAELIIKAGEMCDCGKTIVASGSIITKNKVYADMVTSFLPGNKKLVIPQMPQIYGAAKMCFKLCGADSTDFDEKFRKQYEIISEE